MSQARVAFSTKAISSAAARQNELENFYAATARLLGAAAVS
jgi:hypothetical protein